MIFDPVVHCVAGHQAHVGHLFAHSALQDRIDVGQEKKLRVSVSRGNLRFKGRKDVQIGSVGLCLVQVIEIRTFPEEAFSRGPFNALRIDIARTEDRLLIGAEVLADHGDNAHISKEACGKRKVSRGAAEATLPPSCRSFN